MVPTWVNVLWFIRNTIVRLSISRYILWYLRNKNSRFSIRYSLCRRLKKHWYCTNMAVLQSSKKLHNLYQDQGNYSSR